VPEGALGGEPPGGRLAADYPPRGEAPRLVLA